MAELGNYNDSLKLSMLYVQGNILHQSLVIDIRRGAIGCGLYCSAGSIAKISDCLRAILQRVLYCRATLNTAATVNRFWPKFYAINSFQ